jgi:hypothetical protein
MHPLSGSLSKHYGGNSHPSSFSKLKKKTFNVRIKYIHFYLVPQMITLKYTTRL